jgi:hypothetical protein
MIELIECLDGFDTVSLQRKHPELSNVTDKDGVANWRLRPEVAAALRIVRISDEG